MFCVGDVCRGLWLALEKVRPKSASQSDFGSRSLAGVPEARASFEGLEGRSSALTEVREASASSTNGSRRFGKRILWGGSDDPNPCEIGSHALSCFIN